MSQQATHIQKLVERKQLLEDELVKVDRELDVAIEGQAVRAFERASGQHHEVLPNHMDFGGDRGGE